MNPSFFSSATHLCSLYNITHTCFRSVLAVKQCCKIKDKPLTDIQTVRRLTKMMQMNHERTIMKIQTAISSDSSIVQKSKVWRGYWPIISLIPLYGFKAGFRFETRHNKNDLCCQSKEGTSKNLVFSCLAALWLSA